VKSRDDEGDKSSLKICQDQFEVKLEAMKASQQHKLEEMQVG